ncbi:MAG: type II toxin-antitoxin system RelB family antitoxin [Ruminococcus sp.]
MTISLRLNDEDTKLIKKYAEINNISISDLFRQSVLERIEDEYDLECYNKAMAEYKNNPVTHTLDEVKKELGL